MKKTTKKGKKISAEQIADMADEGKDITEFFSNRGKMKNAPKRVNVDFSEEMLEELDILAGELNISRQAIIKSYLRQALDQHYLAKKKIG